MTGEEGIRFGTVGQEVKFGTRLFHTLPVRSGPIPVCVPHPVFFRVHYLPLLFPDLRVGVPRNVFSMVESSFLLFSRTHDMSA